MQWKMLLRFFRLENHRCSNIDELFDYNAEEALEEAQLVEVQPEAIQLDEVPFSRIITPKPD